MNIELHLVGCNDHPVAGDGLAVEIAQDGDSIHADVYCTEHAIDRARDYICAFILATRGMRLAA